MCGVVWSDKESRLYTCEVFEELRIFMMVLI